MSVNGPISPKQCYYEMDYSFYSFYWLDSLEIRLDHNSTYYRSLSKNSDVKPRISHCDSQNLQYKTHPEFWPSHRRIFKTSLYYKMRLILETRRYVTPKAITGTTNLVPYFWVKSLQFIWRSGTRRFYLRVPTLQMYCRLDYKTGYRDSSPSNDLSCDMFHFQNEHYFVK